MNRDPSQGRETDSSIDWQEVRERLAHRNAVLAQTFAGRGPWADAMLDRRAAELAEPPPAFDRESAGIPMLVARGAETLYGMELRHLGQIVPMPRLARVPGAPHAVLGVIAVAGRVMRLFDVDRLCGNGPGTGTDAEQPGYAVVLRTGGAAAEGSGAGGRHRPAAHPRSGGGRAAGPGDRRGPHGDPRHGGVARRRDDLNPAVKNDPPAFEPTGAGVRE